MTGSAIARALASAALAIALAGAPAAAQDVMQPDDATDLWDIARGGGLYDKWWAVTEVDPPEGAHPAYPAAGKQKGSSTWRCKECHGWDMMGADGAYASGSHFSGVKGLKGAEGRPVEEIVAIIRGDVHGYTEAMMSDRAARKLAMFVSRGQIAMDKYIDRATKAARGDAARGARYYQTICAVCHGYDGKDINFKDEAKPEYVGTVGAKNPWEALHKIRFGQPGVGMVALAALDEQTLVDILAYTQTLPVK